uniref:VWA domain-containing protein n=1 Tax=Eiseniibacteriota bacterium TaxID=2212470 RepID=A0A832I2C8_UNCEI
MNFLNPLFLSGLAAAAIPILIHLFTRRRPREVRFPSLEFLAEVNQSEIRRLRLKQWLLLALRTLAVAAIALAMARPALRGTAGPAGAAATTVVALVDVSGSMGARAAGGGTLAAEARRVVEDLLGTLGPADELLLVPYDRAPRPVTPKPSADAGRLRAAAQALEAGAHATDHAQALAFAARALAESRALNRELFWIGDFQATGFADGGAPAAPAGPWDAARVYLVPLAPASRANAALTDAAPAPAGETAALSVSGAGFGVAPGDVAVAVRDRRGELGRGFLALPARGEAFALLPLARLPEDGGWVELPNDALALDNRRAFAAGRSGTVRVALREDGPPSALRLALEAGAPASGLAVEALDAATLPARLPECDVLVVHDVAQPGPVETQAVLDWVRGGGAVLFAPGRRADAAAWAPLLEALGAGALGPVAEAPPGAAWRLGRAVAGHPVLAGFPARPGEPLSAARFTAIRAFTPAPGARVLLEFDRRHPALVETPRALVLLAPADPEASDLAVSGAFLPLLHQAVKVLGRGTAAASLLPGERYRAPAATGAWRIEDEDGREVPSELAAAAGATRLVSAPLERPGLYRVLQDGRLRAVFAVNPDPRESDLAPVAEPALVRAFPPGRAQVVRPGGDLARRVREARYGRELWSWFVIAALALLAAESAIGRWGMAGARAPAGPARPRGT